MMRSTTRNPSSSTTLSAVGTGNLTKKYYATSPDAYILTTSTSDVATIAATFDADFTTSTRRGHGARSGSRRRVCDPLPGRRLCQLAQHDHSLCVGRRRRD
jgi:hypothetical protein